MNGYSPGPASGVRPARLSGPYTGSIGRPDSDLRGSGGMASSGARARTRRPGRTDFGLLRNLTGGGPPRAEARAQVRARAQAGHRPAVLRGGLG
ncbi:hypothetical protein GCM10009663_24120 [Kitasatospora arboriphila]|uniref:Uncharacterized protein n=1 Tax=Kitasatospora arboriphila TaxID=258052 RepID=A0ABP4DYV2_9ACTN